MSRAPLLLLLSACAAGVTVEEVDQLVGDHDADPGAHGGPFATPVDVAAAVGAHDADDGAHQGLFATPEDVDAAVASADLSVEQLPLRTRQIAFPLGATHDLGGGNAITGGAFGNTGLHVRDVSGSKFGVSFIVPDDLEGDTATLEVVWRIDQTGCTFDLRPNSVDRSRVGLGPSTGGATDGFNGPAEAKDAPGTAMVTAVYTYELGGGGGYTGLVPGDGIALSWFRNNSDTCTEDALVTGIRLLYDAR